MTINQSKPLTIGVAALSGPADQQDLDEGIKKLTSLGFQIILADNTHKQGPHYLAGCDETRIKGLHDLFENPEVDLIMCTKGGYGTPRLTQFIDMALIKKHPKPLIGYSDVSYILNLIHHHTGLITYHGVMVCGDFTKHFSEAMFRNLNDVIHAPTYHYDFHMYNQVEVLKEGEAKGKLIGGNLCLMTVLLQAVGLDYFKDTILLLEDVNEPLYELDRLLMTLSIGGVFEHVNGLMIGQINPVEHESEHDIKALFKEVLTPFNKPVLYGVPFSHTTPRRCLPLGARGVLNTHKLSLSISKAHQQNNR